MVALFCNFLTNTLSTNHSANLGEHSFSTTNAFYHRGGRCGSNYSNMPLSVLPLCTRLLLWNTSLGSRNPNTGDFKLLYAPLWFVCGQILFKIARCSGALVVGVPLWLLCSSFCSKSRFNFVLSPDSLLLSNQLPVIWEVESWLREITRLIACLLASLAIYFHCILLLA